MWLRAGRAQRNLTLDDVARVTKIQPRILQKIEAGNLEGLPAEVFVRGFIKSFARCVGLDESEAVERYGQAAAAVKLGGTNTVARAFVETLVAAPVSRTADGKAPTLLQAPMVPPLPEILPEASMELEPIKLEEPSIEVEIIAEPMAEAELAAASVVEPPVSTAVVEPAAVAGAIEVVDNTAAPVKKKRARKKAAAGTTAPKSRKKKSGAASVDPGAVASADVTGDVTSGGVASDVTSGGVDVHVAVAVADNATSTSDGTAVSSTSPAQLSTVAAIEVVDASSAADELFAPADGIVIDQDLAQGSEPHVSGPVEKVDAEAIGFDAVADHDNVTGQDDVVTSAAVDLWKPTMPPVAPSVPWKRPTSTQKAAPAYTMPSLVIDDADPDIADRQREDRETSRGPHRVSFLPPILLDREDKSTRQGGLTLAVILLLIAATLTLSYLMRRPSVSGDGVTQLEPARPALVETASLG